MTRPCTCKPEHFADPACPRHGLEAARDWPPMDPHRAPGESPAAAQRRLYLAAAPDRVRVEAAGFPWPLRAVPSREGLGQR